MRHIFFIIAIIFFINGCSFYQNLNSTHPIYNTSKETKLKIIANEWKKTPYVLGGTSKRGADCSGFTQSALAQLNIHIPRTTKTQLGSGRKISKSKLQAGDLVFFKTGRGPNGMHVGIYTSQGKFIHLSTKGGVKEVELNTSYWKARYIGARRY
ncbi:TPA: C40 family peptidase [Campylobacter jejuni]|nr:C40 family peptidase [Campylobacter jejuni]HDZ5010118.1 C40 family peptidase [Campylobacter jejuni]HDZ5038183.1 C40 family peptidase [Campylobacter jejuni]HDZ5046942.1 C40 family peptidase [Campylobacter jejuni]HDZ5049902.1 C40 family peptidase [Campylobacter jejuni]